jgi:hypothetical protein
MTHAHAWQPTVCLLAVWLAAASVPITGTGQDPSAAPARAQAPASPPAGRGASPFVPPEPLDYGNRSGWTSLFDGRTLEGWSGNPAVWSVENGAITAASTAERRVGSTHLLWTGGEPADFELKLELKLDGDIHSGIAYRSYLDPARAAGRRGGAPASSAAPRPASVPPAAAIPADPRWTLYGPGLDFDQDRQMAGNVEERGTPRREIAWRGGVVRAESGQRPRLVGVIGDADQLMSLIKADDWNQVHIIARGHQLTHIINGQVMTVLFDDDPAFFRDRGMLGLQIEMYGAGKVHVREIWLKQFTP